MMTALKRPGKSSLSEFGLEIHKKTEPTPACARLRGALYKLSTSGFHPYTVIDVGAANETLDLYEAFPEARILLIEPLTEFEPFFQRICDRYKAEYILSAPGEAPGTATLNAHPDGYGSSFLKEVEGPSVDGVPRQVPVITIDQACAERSLKGPISSTVDVRGAELRVLAGALRTLLETEAVVLEITLFGMMIGGP